MTARIVLWVGREEEEMRIARLVRVLGSIGNKRPDLLKYIVVIHDWKGSLKVLINSAILKDFAKENLENCFRQAWEAENECEIEFEYVHSQGVK